MTVVWVVYQIGRNGIWVTGIGSDPGDVKYHDHSSWETGQ